MIAPVIRAREASSKHLVDLAGIARYIGNEWKRGGVHKRTLHSRHGGFLGDSLGVPYENGVEL